MKGTVLPFFSGVLPVVGPFATRLKKNVGFRRTCRSCRPWGPNRARAYCRKTPRRIQRQAGHETAPPGPEQSSSLFLSMVASLPRASRRIGLVGRPVWAPRRVLIHPAPSVAIPRGPGTFGPLPGPRLGAAAVVWFQPQPKRFKSRFLKEVRNRSWVESLSERGEGKLEFSYGTEAVPVQLKAVGGPRRSGLKAGAVMGRFTSRASPGPMFRECCHVTSEVGPPLVCVFFRSKRSPVPSPDHLHRGFPAACIGNCSG